MKNILFVICILLPFILGYKVFNTWWRFVPSSILILVITWSFFPKNWKNHLGINFSFKEAGVGTFLCIVFAVFANIAIKASLPTEYMLGWNQHWGYLSFVHYLFQSLNEELLFRALLLNSLLYLGFSKWKVVIIPALIFSLLHWCFYSFDVLPENRGAVDFSALIALFLFASSAGLIFIKTRSIMLPWAIHAGWNFNRFGMGIVKIDAPQEKIPEYLSFNLLEGSNTVMLLSVVLIIVTYILCKNEKRN